jgi:hypothetical protein
MLPSTAKRWINSPGEPSQFALKSHTVEAAASDLADKRLVEAADAGPIEQKAATKAAAPVVFENMRVSKRQSWIAMYPSTGCVYRASPALTLLPVQR